VADVWLAVGGGAEERELPPCAHLVLRRLDARGDALAQLGLRQAAQQLCGEGGPSLERRRRGEEARTGGSGGGGGSEDGDGDRRDAQQQLRGAAGDDPRAVLLREEERRLGVLVLDAVSIRPNHHHPAAPPSRK